MLQFITGRSGSGKTTELFARMQQLLTEDSAARLYMLVPEQASFENEKRLLTLFGNAQSQRIEVLSFTRLAELVFRESGKLNGQRMDGTMSLLLMSRAFAAVQDELRLYGKQFHGERYLQELLHILTECKQCGITPSLLTDTATTLPDGILKEKTHDLSLIFGAYDALVAQAALLDPQDDLTVLAKRLGETRLFAGTHWFIDGFNGFTGQEFAVLETLLSRATAMTVALCSDSLTDNGEHTVDRFYTANHTASRLREMAFANHIPVAKVCHLTENRRTNDGALQQLETSFFAWHSIPYPHPTESIFLTACRDREEECVYAARTIRRLLRENGGFCRDFTVVVRNPELYNGLLESAFKREGLPYYIDTRESILTQPLISLVESAMAAVTEGWNTADVLRLCKSGLLGFSSSSTAVLENYALLWGVRGKAWLSPFTQHPDGLGETVDERSERRLTRLNLLRERLTKPLKRFQTCLAGNRNGREFATAVFQLLQEWHVPRMVRFQTARLATRGEHALSENHARLWDSLMVLLDKFAIALDSASLSAKSYAELFHLAVSNMDMGAIPQTLDSVHIGSADRIRYTAPKTVLLLGANEGIFPAYPSGGSIFSDRERRRLVELGLPLVHNADRHAAEERYFAYMAVSACSERLIVTYATQNNGEKLYPSVIVETIKQIVRFCAEKTATVPDVTDTESVADAFEQLALRWHENSVAAASLRQVFAGDPLYAARLQAAERLSSTLAFENTDLSRRLFGEHLRLSPTQVDTFYRCRFAYFCKYGLRLKPRPTAKLNAAQAGLLAHYVMQTVLPVYVRENWEGCTENRVKADTERAVERYVAEQLGDLDGQDARLKNLIAQLTTLSASLLWRVVQELKQSRFVPVDYELPIGRFDDDGNGIPPWILHLPDGATVQVRGTVDRVDILKEENGTYVRVVDYKTGNKEFSLSEVLEGLNLQMLIYLFSISEDRKRYGETLPAGVLYLPAKLPIIQVSRHATDEEIENAKLATMRMNGLLLDDPVILEAMEADIGGVFIPASKTKSGSLSTTSSLASLAQFGRIQQRVSALLTEMATLLHQGEVAAVPVDSGGETPCRYCEYRDICTHETDDPTRTLVKQSLKEALADLEESEDEEESTDE